MSDEIRLPTEYQQFIHLSRYSRWLENKGRRETWEETVNRYFNFFDKHLAIFTKGKLSKSEREELRQAVLNLEVLPSMRCLMTAGEALERDNIAGYNCAYVHINRVRAFDEILYVLMCGTGVGFSVERQFVEKLPTIAEEFSDSDTLINVADSKQGWAKAFRELISLLIVGQIPKWDVSKVRPAGARLKTFGGRASGPRPLEDLFKFTVETFRKSAGRKLTSIECHDIVCKIAEIVVVGGVRRSALISLSELGDERMRNAKSGAWWEANPQRALANNSVAYKEKPEIGTFMQEWLSLYNSKSGERGIFNRAAAQKTVSKLGDRRDPNHEFGTNPCSEIILRDREFCNLTEIIIRPTDTVEDLLRKARIAAILGTMQASLTNFQYISSEWSKNCKEEALLGVSMTGQLDNKMMLSMSDNSDLLLPSSLPNILETVKNKTIEVNTEWAKRLGINPAAAITCVKPSGTVSQLTDAASGMHPRHSQYYIRTVRADIKDPLCQMMQEAGFPSEPCVMRPDHTRVFSFPMKSPDGCLTRNDLTAIEHLNLWLTYQRHWCEHKPSITITVREHEWMDVGAWVYEHFDEVSGISFLPHSDHSYKQAPYQDCTKEEYETLLAQMPKNVNWSDLSKYEKEDRTAGSQTYACSGDKCELVDLTSS
jgi:ribonucleoside-diphosphate reductase alpha chain